MRKLHKLQNFEKREKLGRVKLFKSGGWRKATLRNGPGGGDWAQREPGGREKFPKIGKVGKLKNEK